MLFFITVFPFPLYKLVWIARSKATTGTMCFMGKSIDGQFAHSYPVIKFSTNGRDTVFFNGTDELMYQKGESIAVRYQQNNPSNARISSFKGLWMDTLIYALIPMLILSIIYFHPDLLPQGASVKLGMKPVISVLEPADQTALHPNAD